MKVEIQKYIAERYPRWHDFAAYHATSQNMAELATDILHEVILNVIFMDGEKVSRLFNATDPDKNLRELDFFVLKMIRLNCQSETAPFRHKYKPFNKHEPLTRLENQVPDRAAELDQTDLSIVKLRHIRIIRAIGELLNLNELERDIFNEAFISFESVSSILPEQTKRIRYQAYTNIKEAIQLIVSKNGLSKIKTKLTTKRSEILATEFLQKFTVAIINPGTILEKIKIYNIMERKIYWKDSYSITELGRNLAKARNSIQSIVDSFKALGINVTDVKALAGMIDQRRKLVDESLESFVFNTLFPDTPIGIKRDVYRGLVELPALSDVKGSFETLMDYYGGVRVGDHVYFEAYSINQGQVEIIPFEAEKLERQFTECAETKDELTRLEVVNNLCKVLDELTNLTDDEPSKYNVKGVTEFDSTTGKFVPGRLFVKHGGITAQRILGSFAPAEGLIKSSPTTHSKISADATDAEYGAAMAKRRNENSGTLKSW